MSNLCKCELFLLSVIGLECSCLVLLGILNTPIVSYDLCMTLPEPIFSPSVRGYNIKINSVLYKSVKLRPIQNAFQLGKLYFLLWL